MDGISEEAMRQIRQMGETKGYDVVEYYIELKGHPVYRLTRSVNPPRGKCGLPILLSVDEHGVVYRLDYYDVHDAMMLRRRNNQEA